MAEGQQRGKWNVENVEVFFDDEDRRAVVAVHALYSVRVSRDEVGGEWTFFEGETPEDLRDAVLMALAAADVQVGESDSSL